MSRNKTAEWQPFETAPKDGTELIFGFPARKGFRTPPPTSMLQRDNGGEAKPRMC